MFTDFYAFVLFVVVTTITPGPNNITSLLFSLSQGFRQTLPYMVGILSGVFMVQVFMSTLLYFFNTSESIAGVLHYMRYVGAAYIVFLAYKTLRMNISWQGDTTTKATYVDGFLLQSVNPKPYFFIATILTTFINYREVHYLQLIAMCSLLTSLTALALMMWGGVGALLKQLFERPIFARTFGVLMSLGLLYAAYKIVFP